MKNKGIWLVMAGIIAVGIFITICTALLVNNTKTQGFGVLEPAVESAVAGATKAASLASDYVEAPKTAAARSYAAGVEDTREAAGNEAEDTNEQEPETALIKMEEKEIRSPLETASAGSGDVKGRADEYGILKEDAGRSKYRTRLEELDAQIKKSREEGREPTTYAMKSTAYNELKLWDSELNLIYNDILKLLSKSDAADLVAEERQWMKDRDSMAVEAAKKFAGGTLEGVEYMASLANTTRERAYQLAEVYEQVSE